MATIKARIGGLRSGTSALWTSANPVLLAGEPAFETDTKRFRIGDGVTAYNSLPFITLNASGYQAAAAMLTSLAGLGTAANKAFYATAPDTLAEFDLSPFARTLLDDLTADDVLTTLGIIDRVPANPKHTIWLPAGAWVPTITDGAAYASQEMPTNGIVVSGFDFDAGSDRKIQTVVAMPKSWNEGVVQIQPFWKDGATAGAGDVVWATRMLAIGNDDAIDQAFGGTVTVTDSFIVAGDLHAAPVSADITPGGSPSENDMLVIELFRDGDAVADTYTETARFIGAKLTYTSNAGDDT